MATVVPADERTLSRILAAAPIRDRGLTREALTKFEAAQSKTAWARGHRRRFALQQDGHLLAAAEQYDLHGILDGQPVTICGIAGLVSLADRGEANHVGALVDHLLQRAERDGADLALLFRDPHSPTPVPHGFDAIPTTDAVLSVIESPRYGAPMTMVRGGEDRDLAAIAAMGKVRAERSRFHLCRDEEFIKHVMTRERLLAGLGCAGVRQLEFVIAEEGITAAAYVVISVERGSWTIGECGDRDVSGARVGALLQALIAREPRETRPVIRGWLPPGFLPPQVTLVSARQTPAVLFARPLSARAPGLQLSPADVLYWRNDLF